MKHLSQISYSFVTDWHISLAANRRENSEIYWQTSSNAVKLEIVGGFISTFDELSKPTFKDFISLHFWKFREGLQKSPW